MKRIIHQGENCWRVEPVSAGGLLIDGREYYSAFYRAAKEAKSYILMAGWQFDSEVALVRGEDAGVAEDVKFLPFLNSLCRENPNLRIYILAWDYSALYAMEREPFQREIFKRNAHERVIFRMDGKHPVGASHHQKFVVIDGKVAFAGGMDICSSRWDERDHLAEDPERSNSDGSTYGPFHDTQVYMVGSAAESLTELFKMRWESAFSEELDLSSGSSSGAPLPIQTGLPVAAKKLALSRTIPESLFNTTSIEEIRKLWLDAIDAAEHLIYLENQYFTSVEIFKAITSRMRDGTKSRLQIIIMLPKQASSLVEEVALAAAQSDILESLQQTAADTGHDLGIYYPAARGLNGEEIPVYIHSKVLIVDDRFLSVGSANTTNRSMGLDTELNISWEADDADDGELIHSIRNIRNSLLAEHVGLEAAGTEILADDAGNLVERLDRLTTTEGSRLKQHPVKVFLDKIPLGSLLKMKELSLDPSRPYPEMLLNEILSPVNGAFFAEGIISLRLPAADREAAQGVEDKHTTEESGLKLKIDLDL